MTVTSKMSKLAMASALVSFFGASAAADQVTMTFNGMGASDSYGVAINGSRSWNDSAAVNYTSPIRTGERLWTNQYGADVVTYCIQLYESIAIGHTYVYDVESDLTTVPETPPYPGPMNATQAGLMGDLYARFIDPETGHLRSDTDLTNSFSANSAAAGFQLAVWEITHESVTDGTLASAKSELSLGLGAFRADSPDEGSGGHAASMIFSLLGNGGWENSDGKLFGLSSQTAQDQLMIVPLPVSSILAGLGLLGAFALRRRFIS